MVYPTGRSFFWMLIGYISQTNVFELYIDNLILDSLNFTQTPIFLLQFIKNKININNLVINNTNFERASFITDYYVAISDIISLN
jgi:hypothetical protein